MWKARPSCRTFDLQVADDGEGLAAMRTGMMIAEHPAVIRSATIGSQAFDNLDSLGIKASDR